MSVSLPVAFLLGGAGLGQMVHIQFTCRSGCVQPGMDQQAELMTGFVCRAEPTSQRPSPLIWLNSTSPYSPAGRQA